MNPQASGASRRFVQNTLLLCILLASQCSVAQEVRVNLEEAQVSDVSLSKIIQTASIHAGKKMKISNTPYFYGNSQYEKIVESNNRVVQYDCDYGVFLSSGYVRYEEWPKCYVSYTFPLYSAYSYRYSNQGKDTIQIQYVPTGKNSFNTNARKIFTAMQAVTYCGPIFSDSKYYEYKLLRKDQHHYVISFRTREEFYPTKNRVLCYGTMEISRDSLLLESMHLTDISYHLCFYRRKFHDRMSCPYHTSMDINFSTQLGITQMTSCTIVTQWHHDAVLGENLTLDPPSRPYPAKNKLVEREAWQLEKKKILPANLKFMIPSLCVFVNGIYNDSIFAKLPKLLDPTKAYADLSQDIPLETQYKQFNYSGMWNYAKSSTAYEEFHYPLRIQNTITLINTLFDRHQK